MLKKVRRYALEPTSHPGISQSPGKHGSTAYSLPNSGSQLVITHPPLRTPRSSSSHGGTALSPSHSPRRSPRILEKLVYATRTIIVTPPRSETTPQEDPVGIPSYEDVALPSSSVPTPSDTYGGSHQIPQPTEASKHYSLYMLMKKRNKLLPEIAFQSQFIQHNYFKDEKNGEFRISEQILE